MQKSPIKCIQCEKPARYSVKAIEVAGKKFEGKAFNLCARDYANFVKSRNETIHTGGIE